jgi:hypothetical protein
MALESGTFINDLVATNPPGTDLKSQGDDHLQLIKKVLKNTFPNATRPYPIPTGSTRTADSSVAVGDQNSLILINNSGPVVLTMPALTTTDAGWMINVLKIATGAFPVFVTPPSGLITSGQVQVARARRAVPGVPFMVLWTGSNWVVERCVREPVGSIVPHFMPNLPAGYELPNGQTLVGTDYPEYFALKSGSGVTPDMRERVIAGSAQGAPTTGRIAVARSGIDPTVLGAAGGSDGFQVPQGNLPNAILTFSGSGSISGSTSFDGTHSHQITFSTAGVASGAGGVNSVSGPNPFPTDAAGGHTHSVSGSCSVSGSTSSINGGVSQTQHQNMPPTLICNYALAVE